MRIYEKVNENLQQLKENFKEKNNLNPSFQSSEMSKLLIKSKACEVGDLLSRFYGDCDSFILWLKNHYLILKKSH